MRWGRRRRKAAAGDDRPPSSSLLFVSRSAVGWGTMASRLRLTRNANQPRRFRFVLLILGCLVVTVTFLVVSKPQALVLPKRKPILFVFFG